jgi:hypothetical protein
VVGLTEYTQPRVRRERRVIDYVHAGLAWSVSWEASAVDGSPRDIDLVCLTAGAAGVTRTAAAILEVLNRALHDGATLAGAEALLRRHEDMIVVAALARVRAVSGPGRGRRAIEGGAK